MTEQRTTRSSKKGKHTAKRKPSWAKRILLSFVALFTLMIIAGGAVFFYWASGTPTISESDLQSAIQTQIYASDGTLITSLGSENRTTITEEEVPQRLKDAILSIEDRRFYEHHGFDLIRIIGSFINNLKAGDITQGGSTITQQLVKLSVFSTNESDQTYKRKVQEVILAWEIENKYTKDQILTFYLNKVFMGNGTYGFGTASTYYYGVPLSELTIAQTATLAGMPQAPSYYDPYTNPEATKERRDIVLQTMYETNTITKAELDEALATDITQGLVSHNVQESGDDNNLIFDSFLSIVINEVQEKTGLNVYNDGLTIETTVHPDIQKRLYDIVNTDQYVSFTDDEMQTAVAMVDATTGGVKAIIGGRKQTALLAYNRATQLNRSTGSTIKPLMDYGPAIEYLQYATATVLNDVPTTFSSGETLNNWDFGYMGNISLRRALYLSRNTTALQLFRAVGTDNIESFLKKVNIEISNDGIGLVESNSIGAEVAPLKLAAAYAAFSNYGTYSAPYTVTKVTTRDGKVYNFSPVQNKAMEDYTAYMITDILKNSFTASDAWLSAIQISGVPQAAKTGSTNYTDDQLVAMGYARGSNIIPDSWFAGYTTDYSVAVWVGYDSPFQSGHGLNSTEQMIARKIYYQLMNYATDFSENKDWTMPSSVVKRGNELYVRGSAAAANYSSARSSSSSSSQKLTAPTGLGYTFDYDTKRLTISWDPISTTESDTPIYTVTVNGNEQSTSNTSAVFTNVTDRQLTVSVYVTVGSQKSDSSSGTITLEQPASSSQSQSSSNSSSTGSTATSGGR